MLWDDFVNSLWRDWKGGGPSRDRLDDAVWRQEWMAKHGLAAAPPTERQLIELKRLRDLLFRLIQRLETGETLQEDELAALNEVLLQGETIRSIAARDGRYEMQYSAARQDWRQVMSDIAASFAEALSEGDTSRFRVCDNPDCLWVYYDDTRNRSKRYCDDKMCGNLMKVRRFRARKKAELMEAEAAAETPNTPSE